jgi:TPR repeat protein
LELGSADAALGLFFLSMEPPGRDVERAAASLRRAADARVAGAHYHLAVRLFPWPAPSTGRFRRGTLGLPHDLVESKRLLDLSARQKFPAAVCLLAELYARKDFPGYQADPQLARRYLEEAIALDVPRAYTLRGLWSLQDDPGVISVYPKDERAAFAAFRQGATLGDALACARLGDLYECGAGMDYPEREGSWRPIPPRYGSSKEPALPYYELSHLALHWYTKAMQRGGDEYAARRLIDFAGDVGLYRTDGPLPRPVPGDLTPGDVLLNWAKEDPLSQLAFYRLGFGLVPLLSKLRVKRLDGGDPRRIEQALVVLASINDDLNGQWSAARTRGRRELASQIGLAPPEIDPREIDPARGAELLGQLKEYAARMAGDGGLNEAEQAEWGGFIDTATQELLEGYDGFQDVIRKFPGWDDTPEWIRSAPKPSNAGRPAEPKIPGMIVPIP